jgi:RNA recognition motif-containing protein
MHRQAGNTEAGNMNRKGYVAILPYQAMEAELKNPFSRVGDVLTTKIIRDRQSGQPRRIAFVEMFP